MVRLFTDLGFAKEKAELLSNNIMVDPARGSGHAMGAARRADHPHLRTRVGAEGMDYKGYNIAVHEMGHNVEQVFSLHMNDHTALAGVPNTAFTEALAFVFQAQDLKLLGLDSADPQAEALKALNDFWAAFEIAGVALGWLILVMTGSPSSVLGNMNLAPTPSSRGGKYAATGTCGKRSVDRNALFFRVSAVSFWKNLLVVLSSLGSLERKLTATIIQRSTSSSSPGSTNLSKLRISSALILS